jgi:hypothetical protein
MSHGIPGHQYLILRIWMTWFKNMKHNAKPIYQGHAEHARGTNNAQGTHSFIWPWAQDYLRKTKETRFEERSEDQRQRRAPPALYTLLTHHPQPQNQPRLPPSPGPQARESHHHWDPGHPHWPGTAPEGCPGEKILVGALYALRARTYDAVRVLSKTLHGGSLPALLYQDETKELRRSGGNLSSHTQWGTTMSGDPPVVRKLQVELTLATRKLDAGSAHIEVGTRGLNGSDSSIIPISELVETIDAAVERVRTLHGSATAHVTRTTTKL